MSEKKDSIRKTNREAVFRNTASGQEFWAANGLVIRNLNELAGSFETMDEYTFSQHVNAEKNDFARWTSDVLNQHDLAEKLGKSKSLTEHHVQTLKHMVGLLK